MSKQEKMNRERGDSLATCTITELEELLNAAAQDVPIDEAYVAELEAAILRCETERPTGRLSEPDEAWERFRRTRLVGDTNAVGLTDKGKAPKVVIVMDDKRQPRRPRRLGRALLIAAVIVVMITLLLPPVLGYRDIFHMVAQWTDEQFRFVTPEHGSPETAEKSDDWDDTMPLMESLKEHDLPLSFAPTWIPGDRQLLDVKFEESENGAEYFTAIFSNENEEHALFYKLVRGIQPSSGIWEKDDRDAVMFPYNGIVHYIITNNELVGAHWYVGQFEVAIYGHISIDEVKSMIKSVYDYER